VNSIVLSIRSHGKGGKRKVPEENYLAGEPGETHRRDLIQNLLDLVKRPANLNQTSDAEAEGNPTGTPGKRGGGGKVLLVD